ncbi:MAG: hypothetical protein EA411_02380 [Saprospirales bacterium]|nr:MAG: hypothetical protein EA411_02380 [Saprospirales bacterium]
MLKLLLPKVVNRFWIRTGSVLQCLVLIIFAVSTAQTQELQVQVEQDTVVIGSPLQVDYILEMGAEPDWLHWNRDDADLRPETELRDWSEEKENGRYILKAEYVIFDTGLVSLPLVFAEVGLVETSDTFFSPPFEVLVLPPTDFRPELMPIRPIIEEDEILSWPYWLAGAIILAAVLLILFMKKRQSVSDAGAKAEHEVDESNPEELALAELEKLHREKLIENDEINTFHTRLSYVFRKWLQDRYGIQALEQTGAEVAESLRRLDLEEQKIREWEKMLATIDGVKYAKGRPEPDFHKNAFRTVRQFILDQMERDAEKKEGEG